MVEVFIPKNIVETIERHSRAFKGKEIYGWLIGYETDNKVRILLSIPCKIYSRQNIVSAEPSIEEIHELGKVIPKGIGIIGIYHSHPTEVFHSSTDDETIKQFATIYPNFVSMVTNGIETKTYQLIEKEVKEIEPKITKFKENMAPLVNLNFNVKLKTIVDNPKTLTLAYLSSTLREIIEKNAEKIRLYIGEKKVDQNEKLGKYKKKNLEIKFEKGNINNRETEKELKEQGRKNFELSLDFYIVSLRKKSFSDIQPLIVRGIIDAMYYTLKHSIIKEKESFVSPPKCVNINVDGIRLKFNVRVKKEDVQRFLDDLAFRMEYISITNEKERKKISTKILNCKKEMEKMEKEKGELGEGQLIQALRKLQ